MSTTNYRKHTNKSPIHKFFIGYFYKQLFAFVKPLSVQKILDAGCGEGFTLSLLAKEKIGKTLEGVDYFPEAIKIGKKLHSSLKLKQGDIYKLPYKDNAFDLVICTEVLEHLDNPEKALKELKRVTKQYCIISVPNEPYFSLGALIRGKSIQKYNDEIGHINHWSKNEFAEFVKKYFRIKEIKTPFPWTLVLLEK